MSCCRGGVFSPLAREAMWKAASRFMRSPIGTTVGLATDADSRVLDEAGAPLQGLYACGNDVTSVMRGFYPGPGATLGPAVVFAYRAARHLAANA